MRSTPIINSFVGGELSPKLAGRSDIQQYFQSASDLKNMIVEVYGGAKNRPGLHFCEETKTSSKASRLIPFVFSTIQAYVIEVGDGYMRFYKDYGQILDSGSAYEITSPYAEADIWNIQIAPTADIAYLFCPGYPVYKLTRTGHTAWTITAVDFSTGTARPPLLDINGTDITITPTAGTYPAVSLVASASLFNALHVGSIWKILSGKDGVSAPEWETETAYTTSDYVTHNNEVYFCRSNHTSGASFLNDLAAGKWSPQTIYVKITSVTDATHAAGNILYGSYLEPSPAATTFWYEGAWSDYRGYPSCGVFYEGRLFAAATTTKPQTIWGSATYEFENFETGSDDADGLAYTLATDQVEAILWLCPADVLFAGTTGGVHAISSGSSVIPLTPTNVVVKKQTSYAVKQVNARLIGGYVYYFQRYGRKLRELAYNINTDRWDSGDATVLSEHITESGIIDCAYQQEPDNILWCVRTDGKLCSFTRQVEQKVSAWTQHDTDGFVESICVIPGGTDEAHDQVWMIVRRIINGTTKRYVEFMMPPTFEEQEDAFFVDSGLVLDNPVVITGATQANPVVVTAVDHGFSNGDIVKIRGVKGMTELNNRKFKVANKTDDTFELTDPDDDGNIDGLTYEEYESGGEARECFSSISGLDHLEGKTVKVLVDGAVHHDCAVASGAIALDDEYGQVTVGLGYQSRLETNDLEAGAGGTSQGKTKRVIKATIRLFQSLGCYVGVEGKQDEVVFRTADMAIDEAPLLFTGDKEISFPSGWGKQKKILITQDQPLPLHVLAVIPEMDVN